MIVVAEVLRGDTLLVQAIGARRPDCLERQYQDEEKDRPIMGIVANDDLMALPAIRLPHNTGAGRPLASEA